MLVFSSRFISIKIGYLFFRMGGGDARVIWNTIYHNTRHEIILLDIMLNWTSCPLLYRTIHVENDCSAIWTFPAIIADRFGGNVLVYLCGSTLVAWARWQILTLVICANELNYIDWLLKYYILIMLPWYN